MREADARDRKRRRAPTHPSVRKLNQWVASESAKHGLDFPLFDPDDSGVSARALFLLESPGPKAYGHDESSGIVSVDNDDKTAELLWRVRDDARLWAECVVWNAVPWHLGGTPKAADEKKAQSLLQAFLRQMPHLEVVVPMGRVAERVWANHCASNAPRLATLPTWHPSPLSVKQPGAHEHIAWTARRTAALLAPVRGTLLDRMMG